VNAPGAAATSAGRTSLSSEALLDLWFGCALDGEWNAALAASGRAAPTAKAAPAAPAPRDRCVEAGRAIGVSAASARTLAPDATAAIEAALADAFNREGTDAGTREVLVEYTRLGTDAVREARDAIAAAHEVTASSTPLRAEPDPGIAVRLRRDMALRDLVAFVRSDARSADVEGDVRVVDEARALAWFLGAERFVLAEQLPYALRIEACAPTIAALLGVEPQIPTLAAAQSERWYSFVTLAATRALPAGFLRAPQFAEPAQRVDIAETAYAGLLVTIASRLRDAADPLPPSELRDATLGEAALLDRAVQRD
jgi:hypothetical protein